MGNRFRVEVHESSEELQHRRRYAVTAATKERVQMLYWLKSQESTTRQEISQRLARDESTVYRWLQRYKQGGINALLEVKTAPGKPALIPETVMNQLHKRLNQPEGFKSYSQIQEWLTQECQVVVAYKIVHKIVRYKLNAKLKVPLQNLGNIAGQPCTTRLSVGTNRSSKEMRVLRGDTPPADTRGCPAMSVRKRRPVHTVPKPNRKFKKLLKKTSRNNPSVITLFGNR